MIINLTYSIHKGMFKYPSDPELEILEAERACCIDGKFRSGYVEYQLRNHHGTHVDAPAHKLAYGRTINVYSPEWFMNNAKLIDLTDKGIADKKNKGVMKKDLSGQLKGLENITALLFYTGYCDKMKEFEGKLEDEEKTNFEAQFTYFTPQAAEYVVLQAPHIKVAGIDSFSFDPRGSNSEAHLNFLDKNILLLETVVNIKELKCAVGNSVFKLYCVPILYREADAAQTRAYAEVSSG